MLSNALGISIRMRAAMAATHPARTPRTMPLIFHRAGSDGENTGTRM
jgi:hypothetical protein